MTRTMRIDRSIAMPTRLFLAEVGVCLNVDTSLVSPKVFDACARDALTTILGGHVA